MAWLYDAQYGVYVDDTDGEVRDAEGNTLGYVEEDGTFTPEENFSDESVDLSPEDVAALTDAIAENYSDDLNDLRAELLELREEQAAAEGYALAQAELDAAVDAEDAADDDFAAAIQGLSDQLGRPISQTEVERIDRVLPDRDYDDDDVSDIAKRLGITGFAGGDDPASKARAAEARASYIDDRAREVENDFDDETFEDGGGLFADLVRNAGAEESAHQRRLAQATSDPNL